MGENKHFREICFTLAEQARALIYETIPVEESDEYSMMFGYRGFFMQIVFSNICPLIVFNLARPLTHTPGLHDTRIINMMNMNDVLGCHSVNPDTKLYLYRTGHRLDGSLSKKRLLEILEYSSGEAEKAYNQLERLEARV